MRFTLSVTSSADYDSPEYFTAERTFNTDFLDEAIDNIELFLRSAGFYFDRIEAVNDDEEDLSLDEAEAYNRNYDPRSKIPLA